MQSCPRLENAFTGKTVGIMVKSSKTLQDALCSVMQKHHLKPQETAVTMVRGYVWHLNIYINQSFIRNGYLCLTVSPISFIFFKPLNVIKEFAMNARISSTQFCLQLSEHNLHLCQIYLHFLLLLSHNCHWNTSSALQYTTIFGSIYYLKFHTKYEYVINCPYWSHWVYNYSGEKANTCGEVGTLYMWKDKEKSLENFD